jgi:hypothetical protein
MTQGQDNMNSPGAWDTSAPDVENLAEQTLEEISAGVGAFLAPITFSVNSLGDYIGSVI